MPQTPDYAERLARLQAAMKEHGLQAVVLESGPAMLYLTGVRWGKSERIFVVVIPQKGGPFWVLPGFEEARAREMIRPGDEIRIWEEDESPYQKVAARFFVFDGIRKLAPKISWVGVLRVLKAAGVNPP